MCFVYVLFDLFLGAQFTEFHRRNSKLSLLTAAGRGRWALCMYLHVTFMYGVLGLRQQQSKAVWWTGAAGRHLSHGGLHTYVGNCGLNQNGGVYAQDFVPIALVVPGRSARLWANRRQ